MKKERKKRKEWIEWAILIGLFGFLYLTGLHTEVAGFLQRIVLSTGIIQPNTENITNEELSSYHFTLRSIDSDEVINFSKFEGELVFVNFWATWCPPCIAEMPSIQNFYSQYRDKNIKFLIISTEQDIEKVRKFIQRKEFTFPVYQLISPLPDELDSKSIPTTFVIERDGKIVLKNTGMANYDTSGFKSFIDKHL